MLPGCSHVGFDRCTLLGVALGLGSTAGDAVITGHQSWMKKVPAKGEELMGAKSLGKNFTMLTSGPIACKDRLILSEAAYPMGNVSTGKKAKVYAATAKPESLWVGETDDEDHRRTADTATMIVDMAVFGQDLALTTTEGLKFIALKK
jgi:hypothetical protein